MWHAALLEGLARPDSKSRSEALSAALDSLGKGAAAQGDPPAYLHELCAALAPSLSDNNVKIATQAAGVVDLLCAGGGLPEGAFRSALDGLVPPLTELLGNAKVRALGLLLPNGGAAVNCRLPPHCRLPCLTHLLTLTHILVLFFFCYHHHLAPSPRGVRALPARSWRSWPTAARALWWRRRAARARA
jgi:hypothetical protein